MTKRRVRMWICNRRNDQNSTVTDFFFFYFLHWSIEWIVIFHSLKLELVGTITHAEKYHDQFHQEKGTLTCYNIIIIICFCWK